MANIRTKDLTEGPPLKLITGFMLPLIFGLLFQQFYSMADTVIVGKYLGTDALAGVGSTGSISFLVIGLVNGICAGFAIPVAQKFGQRNMAELRRFVGSIVRLGAAVALAATLITTLMCRNILVWMHTPEGAFQYAYDYIRVIFLGIPAALLYNLLSGILRSLGDSKTPLLFLIISSLINVGLDILFIVSFSMGAAGAGWATLLAQLVSGLLCLGYIAKKFPILHLSRDDLRYRPEYARHLMAMGLPMGLQYSITAFGNIILQTAVNGLGPEAMAAVTAGIRVTLLCTCPFDAIGTTAATFAGQNWGAGKIRRVHRGVTECGVLGILYSVSMLLAMNFWGTSLTMLFLDPKDIAAISAILPMSRKFLMINAAAYIPLMLIFLLRLTIQGLGFPQIAVFSGVFETAARAAIALCLVPAAGFNAVCLADPAAWIMADLFLIPAYFCCLKKRGFSVRARSKGSRSEQFDLIK